MKTAQEPTALRFDAIAPQPQPTSARIKSLLSRGLTAPASLSPNEVQELAASVVYYLLAERMVGERGDEVEHP